MATDNLIPPARKERHTHQHGHPSPVPHLRPEWPDDHGPDFVHPHSHYYGDRSGHHHNRRQHDDLDVAGAVPAGPERHGPDRAG